MANSIPEGGLLVKGQGGQEISQRRSPREACPHPQGVALRPHGKQATFIVRLKTTIHHRSPGQDPLEEAVIHQIKAGSGADLATQV
jgi:hypothetical protein